MLYMNEHSLLYLYNYNSEINRNYIVLRWRGVLLLGSEHFDRGVHLLIRKGQMSLEQVLESRRTESIQGIRKLKVIPIPGTWQSATCDCHCVRKN